MPATGASVAREAGRRRPGGLLAWIGAGLAISIVALLFAAVLRPADNNPLTVMNRPASDFTLPLYGGGKLRLSGMRGKTVVINFWWSGCQPCVQEAPILERQWRAWKGRGVVFVGVNEQDDPASDAPRRFLHTYGITYPNGWDPGYIDIQYGTTGQPETFIVSPGGIKKVHYVMPFPDDKTLSRLIAQVRV
jgi:thiol-disulfide isomerase/thioredoxin